MFQKAQEVLYNSGVQAKAQFLEFLSENPTTRLKVVVVLMLSSLTSTHCFVNILSYKSLIEVLLVALERLL